MKKVDLERKNLFNYWVGLSLMVLAGSLTIYFIPFYLKEKGLSILQIGTLATLGIAFGNLIGSSVVGRIIRKIKLRTGLILVSVFQIFGSLMFYIFPFSLGLSLQKGSEKLGILFQQTVGSSFIQHNTSKKAHRKTMTITAIVHNSSIAVGLALSVVGIKYIGFLNTLLIFIFISFLSTLFYWKIDDKYRFRTKKDYGDLKIHGRLKALMVAEVLYWLALASSLIIVITFLVTDYFGGGLVWLAFIFGSLYLSISISSFFGERYLGKEDLYKTTIIGMFLLMLSAIIIIFSTNLYSLMGALILEGVGAGIWVPSKTALYWKFTKKDLRERASAYLGGRRVFVNSLGPLMGGVLVTYFGILSPFYFKTFICIISICIYIVLMRND